MACCRNLELKDGSTTSRNKTKPDYVLHLDQNSQWIKQLAENAQPGQVDPTFSVHVSEFKRNDQKEKEKYGLFSLFTEISKFFFFAFIIVTLFCSRGYPLAVAHNFILQAHDALNKAQWDCRTPHDCFAVPFVTASHLGGPAFTLSYTELRKRELSNSNSSYSKASDTANNTTVDWNIYYWPMLIDLSSDDGPARAVAAILWISVRLA